MTKSPFAAILIAFMLAVVIPACDDSKSSDNSSGDSSSSSSNSVGTPQVGSEYITGKPKSPIICSSDDKALNEAMDALGKNDRDGAEQALDGTLTTVPPGTRVLILNNDILRDVLDLRIESGDAEGSRVYCVVGDEDTGFIAKEASGDSDQ